MSMLWHTLSAPRQYVVVSAEESQNNSDYVLRIVDGEVLDFEGDTVWPEEACSQRRREEDMFHIYRGEYASSSQHEFQQLHVNTSKYNERNQYTHLHNQRPTDRALLPPHSKPITMRVPIQHCKPNNSNDINIASTSTLHIHLTISSTTSPLAISHRAKHTPILLLTGVVSTSPPYLAAEHPEFVPHRPTFLPTTGIALSEKSQRRHAALTAHLSAELREDGAWERVGRECLKGRGGYNAINWRCA